MDEMTSSHISFSLFASSHFCIIDDLKLTKSRRRSKSNYITINVDSIDVCDVKYLPASFDDHVFFVLLPLSLSAPSAYGRSMDDVDKVCVGAQQKPQISKMVLESLLDLFFSLLLIRGV